MKIDKELLTTVVGSYPAEPSRKALESGYHGGGDPYLQSLREAVEAQVQAGIELISDGQTRGSMVEIFARELRGFRMREKIEIVSDIDFMDAITVKDLNEVKKMTPGAVGVKGVITGPWTLVKSVDDKHYRDEKDAVMDTAEALAEEAEALSEVCEVIQLDEPFFSVEYPDYAKDEVETVLDVNIPTALHVCGDVSSIAEDLVELDVDILDHEFAENPSLYEIYGDLGPDQRMAAGVVSTENRVEEVSEIKERIETAYEVFGPETMIDPDCGLRNVDERTAMLKLKNMVEARNVVSDERGREDRS